MPISPGTHLGPYQVVAAIGAGGKGEVYTARDARLDRTVAIKVLPEHIGSDPDRRQRFEREAKTVAALSHPHICPVFDVGEQDGVNFLVMEYLEGETLAQRLTRGPLPLDQALRYAIEIADALDKAHRQGVVHRDLKPANVMLTPGGAKLLDFGLAKLIFPAGGSGFSALPTQSAGLTGEGKILGTLQYMAPEQVEGQEADARTDIFAFGATVYEMVTGQKAFEGKSQASLIGAILKDEPRPMASLQPMLPLTLDRVVKKCLAKEPDGRWHSAHDLHDELTWIAEGDSPVGAPPGAAAARQQTGWRRATPWIAGIVMASVVTGLAVWSLTRPAERPPVRFAITLPASDQLFLNFLAPSMALSPDGETLVYVATGDGTRQIYRRALDQLEAVPLPGTEGARYPFFSPDGAWIGFELNGTLKKLALAGGPPATVHDGPEVAIDASWGTNDTIVFGIRTDGNPVLQVPAAGGDAEPVTTLAEGESDHRQPELLPGGTALLFTAASGSSMRIAVKSLETGERRVLMEGSSPRYVPSGHIVFAREDSLWGVPFDLSRLEVTSDAVPVVEGVRVGLSGFAQFAVAANGSFVYLPGGGGATGRTLVWVDREGREERVAAERRGYGGLRLSPDGLKATVAVREGEHVDVVIYDLVRDTPTRLTFDSSRDDFPVWTPDGQRVVFASNRGGVLNLFGKAADGTGEVERLTTSPNFQASSSWSGDRLVFYELFPETSGDIFALSMEGERASETILQDEFNQLYPEVSPDGRWVAYHSAESGQPELYVRPFPNVNEGKWQISRDGGRNPLWMPDGSELFFRFLTQMCARFSPSRSAAPWEEGADALVPANQR